MAAGRPWVPSTVAAAPSRALATPVEGWWNAIPRGQRLRIGFGLVGILLIGLYVLVDTPPGASGRRADEQAPAGAAIGSDELPGAPSAETSDGTAPTSPAPAATAAAPAAPATLLPATPTAAPVPTTVVMEGSGTLVTEPLLYPGGSIRVHSLASTGSGAGCAYIGTFRAVDPAALTLDSSLLTAVVFLEAPGTGEGWVEVTVPPGSYYMEIEADCDWVVTVSPI